MSSAADISRTVSDQELLGKIEGLLELRLAKSPLVPKLQEAVAYALLGGGKRIRPLITARSCEAIGGCVDDALPAGCAIEMIHAFSLVHDDLPALDNDDLRRGKPTLHKVAGEDMAILAGDALHQLAYETAISSPHSQLQIVREILLGSRHMIEGQVLDTTGDASESLDGAERLRTMHMLKTAALFISACRCGALAGKATEKQYAALDRYGQTIGLMFQVVDDLIDQTQATEHLGKTAGKDQKAGKLTFPSVMGITKSKEEISRLQQEALGALDPLGPEADPLRTLAQDLAQRTK